MTWATLATTGRNSTTTDWGFTAVKSMAVGIVLEESLSVENRLSKEKGGKRYSADFLFPFVRLATPVGSCRRHVPIGGAISVKRRSSKGLSWL